MKITIPATIEEATRSLNGIEALLTAKGWERAAIVYAFTEDQQKLGTNQYRRVEAYPSTLSFQDFANLGIEGLRGRQTVARFHKAWADLVERGLAEPAKPGKTVTIPSTTDVPFPASPDTAPSILVNTKRGLREAEEEKIVELIDELPKEAKAKVGRAVREVAARDSDRAHERTKDSIREQHIADGVDEIDALGKELDREHATRRYGIQHRLENALENIRVARRAMQEWFLPEDLERPAIQKLVAELAAEMDLLVLAQSEGVNK